MNSFEINKILGALLGTCLVLLAVHIASGAIFAPPVPAKPGYEIEVPTEQATQPAEGATKAPATPIETLLATASIQAGSAATKVCQSCHTFGKGQPNNVGPNLYGVVGRPVASVAGFNYSAALKTKGGTWTFDALNLWLAKPAADVPGTMMTFAGISCEKQRADVIDYLNSNSDNPLPLPAAAQAAPASLPANAAASAPAAAPANPPAAAPANPSGNAPSGQPGGQSPPPQ